MRIDELKPREVFRYFEEISKIPRGSGNMEQIKCYCRDFAQKHGLGFCCDEYGNVMIFRDGTNGRINSEPVILQAHLDMVCEKNGNSERDMEKEGVELVTDGNYLWADGTTVGGDDGIGAAYILAVLASKDIIAPPIEALLTVDEEIGMLGAKALDTTYLKGRRLINIDSEQEGILIAGCAGAARLDCKNPLTFTKPSKDIISVKIIVDGLSGGHSGLDINKRRKNAARTLAELMYILNKNIGISIADIRSGGKLNVIPRTAEAVVCFNEKFHEEFNRLTADFNKELSLECGNIEPEAEAYAQSVQNVSWAADKDSTAKIIFALMNSFNGIYLMSGEAPELVETSSNIGSVSISGHYLETGIMVRSNTEYGKRTVIRRHEAFMEYIGGKLSLNDEYPAWEYSESSPLREIMAGVYYSMYGKKAEISTAHIGLECGILSEKLRGADMLSFGPDIVNVHTPNEKISVKSVAACWEYFLNVLELLAESN